MENNRQDSRTRVFIILGIVMAVISVVLFYLILTEIISLRFIFLEFVTVPLTINGLAYLVFFFMDAVKGKDQTIVLPLVCLGVAIISAIIGVINYVNDHNFILRGLEAQLIWFIISVPALILSIIHFIASYIHMRKKLKTLEN